MSESLPSRLSCKRGRKDVTCRGYSQKCLAFCICSEVKASACNAGDFGLIPGLGRSPGEGNGNPFQYSCLENRTDRGAWWAAVHGVAKSRTRLSDFTHFTHIYLKNTDHLYVDESVFFFFWYLIQIWVHEVQSHISQLHSRYFLSECFVTTNSASSQSWMVLSSSFPFPSRGQPLLVYKRKPKGASSTVFDISSLAAPWGVILSAATRDSLCPLSPSTHPRLSLSLFLSRSQEGIGMGRSISFLLFLDSLRLPRTNTAEDL